VTKDIRDRLAAQPFQPFVVNTAEGREYNVPTHDHAHVSPSGDRVSIWTNDETEYILPALLIIGLRSKLTASTNRRVAESGCCSGRADRRKRKPERNIRALERELDKKEAPLDGRLSGSVLSIVPFI
jgi:hypothetical protein